MILTHVHSHDARRRSYSLVAEALGVTAASRGAGTTETPRRQEKR